MSWALSREEVLIDAAGTHLAASHCRIGDLVEGLAGQVSAGSLKPVCEGLAISHGSSGNIRVADVLSSGSTTEARPALLNGALGRAAISVLSVSIIAFVIAEVEAISADLLAHTESFIRSRAGPALLHCASVRAAIAIEIVTIVAAFCGEHDLVTANRCAYSLSIFVNCAVRAKLKATSCRATVTRHIVAIIAVVVSEVEAISANFLADCVAELRVACEALLELADG